MKNEAVGVAVIVGVLGVAIWCSQPASSIAGLARVMTPPNLHAVRSGADGDEKITLSTPDGRTGSLVLQHGQLWLEPTKLGDPPPDGKLVLQPLDRKGEPLVGNALRDWTHEHGLDEKPLPPIHVEFTHEYYLYEFVPADLGTFAGFRPSASRTRDDVFEVGLRYSPFRFLCGTIAAPDLLLTRDSFGPGASLYLPETWLEQWNARFLHHFGVEVGYLASFTGHSGPGWMGGISFSAFP